MQTAYAITITGRGMKMKKGLATLFLNLLISELGYRVIWLRFPDGSLTGKIRVENDEGDSREFSGSDKLEQAVHWLRKKV